MQVHYSSDDNSRCRLSFFPGVEGSDYINASHIDVSYPAYTSLATVYILFTTVGLSQAPCLHSNARPSPRHHRRPLENALGAEVFYYCHADQGEGGRKG